MTDSSHIDKPLILTASMDDKALHFFNHKRQEHFPPERNYLDAHLTLFHKLPSQEINVIQSQLHKVTQRYNVLSAKASDIMFMGFGAAYVIDCPELKDIRNVLAQEWQEWLSTQDAQKFKPHVTFQNKVKADLAKQIYAKELSNFSPFEFEINGLNLWYYDGGPWEFIKTYNFSAK